MTPMRVPGAAHVAITGNPIMNDPWRYTPSSGEIIAANGEIIARDVPAEFGALVASAPEMIEVLISLVARWDEYRGSDANQEQAYYKLAKYAYADWDKARAALAKAEQPK